GMWAADRRVAALAALGAAIAGADLGLADSRVQLAFAIATAAAALAWPRATVRADRRAAAAAVALVVSAGFGAWAVAGGYVAQHPAPDGATRLAGLGAVALLAVGAWALSRAAARRGPAAALAVLVALAAAGPVAAALKPPARVAASGLTLRPAAPFYVPHPRPRQPDLLRDRLLHGRLRIWRAAWQTFADRP